MADNSTSGLPDRVEKTWKTQLEIAVLKELRAQGLLTPEELRGLLRRAEQGKDGYK